jgi:hypothetical protein
MYLNSELAITYNEMLCCFQVERISLHGVTTRALLECFAWALLLVMLESWGTIYTGPLPPHSLKKEFCTRFLVVMGGELAFLDTYTSVGQFSNRHLVLDPVLTVRTG